MADRVIERGPTPPAEGLDVRPATTVATRTGVSRGRLGVSRGALTALALAAAIGVTFLVQLPILGHYFFGDDFIPLAEMATNGKREYVKNLALLQDVTTNWRFLTGLYYLAMFEAFGVNARPFLAGSLLVHLGTVALLFWLVRRALDAVWPAFLAAAFFGLAAASVPTVGQVTAFNNVLAGFFVMLAMVTLYEGLDRRRLLWWGPLAAGSFAAAIASNESAAMLAPVFPVMALWKISEEGGRPYGQDWLRLGAVTVAFGSIGGAALIAFAACACTQASNSAVFGSGKHIIGNTWIFLGRLIYPIGFETRPGEVEAAHLVAGVVLALLLVILLVRGPGFGRIAVVFLALALLPQLPLNWALAPRYLYVPSIALAILAAVLAVELAGILQRWQPRTRAAPLILALLASAALGFQGWQTWEQNSSFDGRTENWRELVTGLQEAFPELPEGSKIYVLGGPLLDPILHYSVLPAVGEVLWGGILIATLPVDWDTVCLPPDGEAFVVAHDGGRFTPLPIAKVDDAGNEIPNLHGARHAVSVHCPALAIEP